MVVDVITYNGEKDLFEIRYNILKDHVDKFIVVEFDKTFSGKDKSPYFVKDGFIGYDKVEYFNIPFNHYSQYMEMAINSPNTHGAEHWKMEFCQKESIKDTLKHLRDEDIVFIGDCDEIWDPEVKFSLVPSKILLKVYTYYLNNRSSEVFRGTLVAKYKDIKNECLNHLRSNTDTTQIGGWHFTSLKDDLKRKLTDSYTEESYATADVLENLDYNIKSSKDFLGRNFTFTVDESEWPQYLKDNRKKYEHLCLSPKTSSLSQNQ